MKIKHLKEGELRVIKVDRNALTEFIMETITDNATNYFDLLDITKVTFHMKWDKETDEFYCVINDEKHPVAIDFDQLVKNTATTTDSLFIKPCYKTIYIEDIDKEEKPQFEQGDNPDKNGGWVVSRRLLSI